MVLSACLFVRAVSRLPAMNQPREVLVLGIRTSDPAGSLLPGPEKRAKDCRASRAGLRSVKFGRCAVTTAMYMPRRVPCEADGTVWCAITALFVASVGSRPTAQPSATSSVHNCSRPRSRGIENLIARQIEQWRSALVDERDVVLPPR